MKDHPKQWLWCRWWQNDMVTSPETEKKKNARQRKGITRYVESYIASMWRELFLLFSHRYSTYTLHCIWGRTVFSFFFSLFFFPLALRMYNSASGGTVKKTRKVALGYSGTWLQESCGSRALFSLPFFFTALLFICHNHFSVSSSVFFFFFFFVFTSHERWPWIYLSVVLYLYRLHHQCAAIVFRLAIFRFFLLLLGFWCNWISPSMRWIIFSRISLYKFDCNGIMQ